MIVYGGQEELVDSSERFSLIRDLLLSIEKERFQNHDTIVELLIEWGVFESAIADALCSEVDTDSPLLQMLRHASLLIGRLFYLSAQRKTSEMGPWFDRLVRAFENRLTCPLPQRVTLHVPEGYAYYGLYPESYLEAALRFLGESGPQPAVCIGVRSIGTSLSAVVAATLEAQGCMVDSYTVRPRGHPFDRSLYLSPLLLAALAKRKAFCFLIIDEGPGLSGSSMTSVAGELGRLGVKDDRIFFFPSWEPDGSRFRSDAARQRWPRHRKFTASFEEIFLERKRLSVFSGGVLRDLSGGRWRSLFYSSETDFPAAHPQQERRKYLSSGSPMPGATFQESPRLLKFAGLGRYGRLKQAQAEQLADAGWGAPVIDWTGGFLATVFVEGRPVSGAKVDSILIETMARYLAFRRKAFPATRRRSFDEMIDMIRINISEGVGESGCDRLDRLEQCRGFFEEETPVAVDGRMLPHEWLQTPHGYLKADGIDHHDDHFFPGCQDIAWDLAGGCVEFGFGIPEERRFVEQYQSLTQDRSVRDRLAFYKVAYLAYRLGYVSLAAEALDPSPDAARFKSLFHRYRSLLVRELRLI